MNKRLFTSLLCITILALAPACCSKRSCNNNVPKPAPRDEIRTTIELDNAIIEIDIEEEHIDLNVVKF